MMTVRSRGGSFSTQPRSRSRSSSALGSGATSVRFAYAVMAKALDRQHEHLLNEILRHGVASEVTQAVEADPSAEASTQFSLGLLVAGACPDSPDEFGICDPL